MTGQKRDYEKLSTAARRCDVSVPSLKRAIREGELPYVQRGTWRGDIRVKPEHVDMWIAGKPIPKEEERIEEVVA